MSPDSEETKWHYTITLLFKRCSRLLCHSGWFTSRIQIAPTVIWVKVILALVVGATILFANFLSLSLNILSDLKHFFTSFFLIVNVGNKLVTLKIYEIKSRITLSFAKRLNVNKYSIKIYHQCGLLPWGTLSSHWKTFSSSPVHCNE